MYYIDHPIIDQNLLSSNQIPGSFDHQHLWNEAINVLDFLHKDTWQGNITSKTISFGKMGPCMPNHAQAYQNFSGDDFG